MIQKQGIFADPWLPEAMPLPVDALRSRVVTGPMPGFGPGRVAALAGLGGAPEGLGKVFTLTLSVPGIGSQKFSADVPYEDLAASAVQELKGQAIAALPSILNPALQQAGAYVTDTLWPTMQPKLRAELDRVITIAEGKVKDVEKRVTTKAVVVAGCLLLGVVGSAIFVIRSTRR
jgi:hypothetical protein